MGDMNKATEYGDPSAVAKEWQRQGAQFLHVVDLDAAFAGAFANEIAVKSILEAVQIPVQLGGGIRHMADIKERLALGIERVIIGTAAVEDLILRKRLRKDTPGALLLASTPKTGVWQHAAGLRIRVKTRSALRLR